MNRLHFWALTALLSFSAAFASIAAAPFEASSAQDTSNFDVLSVHGSPEQLLASTLDNHKQIRGKNSGMKARESHLELSKLTTDATSPSEQPSDSTSAEALLNEEAPIMGTTATSVDPSFVLSPLQPNFDLPEALPNEPEVISETVNATEAPLVEKSLLPAPPMSYHQETKRHAKNMLCTLDFSEEEGDDSGVYLVCSSLNVNHVRFEDEECKTLSSGPNVTVQGGAHVLCKKSLSMALVTSK